MFLQGKNSIFDLKWNDTQTYGDIHLEGEKQWSQYNFEEAPIEMLSRHFEEYEGEAKRLLEKELVLPAYDHCLKASHVFNLLDARGAISVTERPRFIARVRSLARGAAEGFLKDREALGFPLLKGKRKTVAS